MLKDEVAHECTVGINQVNYSVGKACLAEDFHDYPCRIHLRIGRLPQGYVAHQSGRRRKVSGNCREVEWRNGQDESLKSTVFHAVPHSGRALGLLGVDFGHELHVKAQKIREFAGCIDFSLVHRFGLSQHGCRIDFVAVGPAHQVGRAQEDSGAFKPGHGRPRGVGGQRSVNGLLDVLLAPPVVAANYALVVMGRTAFPKASAANLPAPDKHRNIHFFAQHLLVGLQKPAAFWASGCIAQYRLVDGLGYRKQCVRHGSWVCWCQNESTNSKFKGRCCGLVRAEIPKLLQCA